MGLLDGALGQLAGNLDIEALAAQFGIDINAVAAQVGLTPEQVKSVLEALGLAHHAPGDTAEQAAEHTGLPVDQVKSVIEQIGGEDAVAQIGGLLKGLGESGGLGGLLGKL